MSKAKQFGPRLVRFVRFASLIFLSLCLTPQEAPSADKITIGYSAIAGLYGYVYVTVEVAVEATYDGLSNALVGPKPYVPRQGVAETIKVLALRRPEAAKLDPRRFIRDEYVKEFDESGFIDSLYRSR